MESSSKGLLTQVTQFWNLLDDLAESNPESYEKFIQQQLKEGKQLCAAPEPQLCLQTRILVCRVGAQGKGSPEWNGPGMIREWLTLSYYYLNTRTLEGNCHSEWKIKRSVEDCVEGVRMGISYLYILEISKWAIFLLGWKLKVT